MLSPKKVKHRKQQRGRLKGRALSGDKVSFGEFGLKAISSGYVTARQIEAARRAVTRHVRRGGKMWIRIFPDKPMTKKPAETRMGSGKGTPEFWSARVLMGQIIFELSGIQEETARKALRLAHHKLPLKTSFVTKEVL